MVPRFPEKAMWVQGAQSTLRRLAMRTSRIKMMLHFQSACHAIGTETEAKKITESPMAEL